MGPSALSQVVEQNNQGYFHDRLAWVFCRVGVDTQLQERILGLYWEGLQA